jgi:hypothetical protein
VTTTASASEVWCKVVTSTVPARRHGQRVGDVLGEQADDQGADPEAAEGGDDRAGGVHAQGGQQQRSAAVDVRQVPGEEQADRHPHGVDGINQSDHQRREPVPAGVEGIQRAGGRSRTR